MLAIVLAAGKGTRMRSERPKVLHEIFGRPLLEYVLDTLLEIPVKRIALVAGSGSGQVRDYLGQNGRAVRKTRIFLQKKRLGTGHAVMSVRAALVSEKQDILIWPGDMPLLKIDTLREFVRQHRESGADASVLSAIHPEPSGYGRILRAGGGFYGIREELDASEAERRIQEINTGIYLFRPRCLIAALGFLKPRNRKKEYYLTDTIEYLSLKNHKLRAFPLAVSGEALGINTQAQLAEAIATVNRREIQRHQANGVTFISPEQTFVAPGARIGKDTVIHPWCYIESGVSIGTGCQIGPYAKIRKGTQIEAQAVIGSFVEIARSRVGRKVVAKHLAYLGDAVIGAGTNVGAGTITANFDGKQKNRTHVGKKVLLGSNTVLVAPVKIADGVKTGAGAVITGRTRHKRGDVLVGVPAKVLKKKTKPA
ncbi:MAG: hypothetical protein A2Z83_00060 [Omnitrophica bacterium GWA2_52_8]|nr:MAG: hypothetical protein A2Z83_00060 [Omnitrophica bacterium GWA2_52_8]